MILIFMQMAAHSIDQGKICASLILLTAFMMIMMRVVSNEHDDDGLAPSHISQHQQLHLSCIYPAFIYSAIFDIIWNILR